MWNIYKSESWVVSPMSRRVDKLRGRQTIGREMWRDLFIYLVFGAIEIIVIYLVISPRAKKWHGEILQIGKFISAWLIVLFIPLVMTYYAKIISEQDNIFKYLIEGLWPEAFGIIFTIVVLDRLANDRAIKAEKRDLILQMGSPDNSFAIEAVRILTLRGWLKDGSLQDARLWKANLQEANLMGANLQNANLMGANLRHARLDAANIEARSMFNSILLDGSMWTERRDMREFTHPNEWKAEQDKQ